MGTDLLAARLVYDADEHGQTVGAEGHEQEGTVQNEVDGLIRRFRAAAVDGNEGKGGRIVAIFVNGDAGGMIDLRKLQFQLAGKICQSGEVGDFCIENIGNAQLL